MLLILIYQHNFLVLILYQKYGEEPLSNIQSLEKESMCNVSLSDFHGGTRLETTAIRASLRVSVSLSLLIAIAFSFHSRRSCTWIHSRGFCSSRCQKCRSG